MLVFERMTHNPITISPDTPVSEALQLVRKRNARHFTRYNAACRGLVEIEDGVEGLVHVSEMDWTNKNIHPSKFVQLGDEVEVMVLDIDEERRRISLGIKQCAMNPWEEFGITHKKGDHVSGKIKSITDFGIFIGLDGGIDGLVHLSDISWDETGEDIIRNFKKGLEDDSGDSAKKDSPQALQEKSTDGPKKS